MKRYLGLKEIFDRAFEDFMHESHLDRDPLGLVHDYEDPRDQEIIGFLAALFAFGQVVSMRNFLKRLFYLLGSHPSQTILTVKASDFLSLQYRFIHGEDIAALVETLRRILLRFGTLEKAFLATPQKDHMERLNSFRRLFLDESPRKSRAMNFLFSDPVRSCGKRWHLFLRWMVRKPPIDLGIWTKVKTSELIIPLDTHIFDIAKALKLSRQKKPSLLMAFEITEVFKTWDPGDPIKYDFSLCQLGVRKLKESWIQNHQKQRLQPKRTA